VPTSAQSDRQEDTKFSGKTRIQQETAFGAVLSFWQGKFCEQPNTLQGSGLLSSGIKGTVKTNRLFLSHTTTDRSRTWLDPFLSKPATP
jgi:hypothetical protein